LLVIKSPDFDSLIHEGAEDGAKVMDNIAQVMASRLKGAADPIDL